MGKNTFTLETPEFIKAWKNADKSSTGKRYYVPKREDLPPKPTPKRTKEETARELVALVQEMKRNGILK